MAGLCEGRVCIITGAGRGIGRDYALMLAAEGAKVVVNDLGGSRDGTGVDQGPAQEVVDEIVAAGGQAVANTDDISEWAGAERLINQAITTFGGLDVLINNAGILRDRMLTNMSEAEWDAVIKVHLKGTAGPSHFAAAYWRDRSKAGETNSARIINTTSPSGIYGNIGQTNYGAAKGGIASFTIIAADELGRYGVTVSAIAPAAFATYRRSWYWRCSRRSEGSNVHKVDRSDRRVVGERRILRGHRPRVRCPRRTSCHQRKLAPGPQGHQHTRSIRCWSAC